MEIVYKLNKPFSFSTRYDKYYISKKFEIVFPKMGLKSKLCKELATTIRLKKYYF